MRLAVLAVALLAAVFAPPVEAGYGQGDDRLEKLYSSFMAPCCWRDNLAEHDSPAAEELRKRIAAMVQAGQSDAQIKETLVADYGQRILTLPEGAARTWLFSAPWIAGALGLASIAWWLGRARRAHPDRTLAPAELPPGWDHD
jgi:cytochrome c-type biogenesis protein CcmH